MRRSQKRQKDSQVKQLFALSEYVRVKAALKHVDETDSCLCFFSSFRGMRRGYREADAEEH